VDALDNPAACMLAEVGAHDAGFFAAAGDVRREVTGQAQPQTGASFSPGPYASTARSSRAAGSHEPDR